MVHIEALRAATLEPTYVPDLVLELSARWCGWHACEVAGAAQAAGCWLWYAVELVTWPQLAVPQRLHALALNMRNGSSWEGAGNEPCGARVARFFRSAAATYTFTQGQQKRTWPCERGHATLRIHSHCRPMCDWRFFFFCDAPRLSTASMATHLRLQLTNVDA